MDYFEMLQKRKSTRKFKDQQLSASDLDCILKAANAAPVGSNLYEDVHLTVVQDRSLLDKLGEAAARRWLDRATMKKIEGKTASDELPQVTKTYDPFYKAPTVIFVSHRKQDLQPGIEWSNVACVALSMHYAAVDLGMGSVIMWFALESMREIPELDNTALLGLPNDFEPLIGLAVGYPVKEPKVRELVTNKIATDYL